MDERILINPDNRFLANSGANDFSLYGAPSDPALTFRAAQLDGDGLNGDAPPSGSAAAGGPPLPSNDIQQSSLAASEAAGPAWGSAAVLSRGPDPAPTEQAAPAEALPTVVSSIAPAAFSPTAPLTAAASAATETAPQAAAPAAPAAPAAAVQPLPEAAQGAAPATPAAPLQPLAEIAPAALTEPLAAAVSGPLASLSIDEALGPAADDVQDLLGSDPAAGIATLVSLVSISDVVDLGDAGASAADVVASPVDSMLDALAADPLGALAPDPDEADDGTPAAGTLLGNAPLGGDDAGDLPFGLG